MFGVGGIFSAVLSVILRAWLVVELHSEGGKSERRNADGQTRNKAAPSRASKRSSGRILQLSASPGKMGRGYVFL